MARTYTGNLSNFTSPEQLLTTFNDKLGGLLGTGFVLGMFVILLIIISQKTGSPKKAWAGSSVITFTLAYLCWGLDLVGMGWVMTFAIFSIMGVIWLYKGED